MEYNNRTPPQACLLCGHRPEHDMSEPKINVTSLKKVRDMFPNEWEGRCADGDYIYLRQRGKNLTCGKAPAEMDAVVLGPISPYLLFCFPMDGNFSISTEELKKFTSAYIDWSKLDEHKEKSIQWMKNFADDQPCIYGYEQIMEFAREYHEEHGIYIADIGINLPKEFWHHYQIITGANVPEEFQTDYLGPPLNT